MKWDRKFVRSNKFSRLRGHRSRSQGQLIAASNMRHIQDLTREENENDTDSSNSVQQSSVKIAIRHVSNFKANGSKVKVTRSHKVWDQAARQLGVLVCAVPATSKLQQSSRDALESIGSITPAILR